MIGDGDCGRFVGGEIGMALSNGVKGDGVYSIDDVVQKDDEDVVQVDDVLDGA